SGCEFKAIELNGVEDLKIESMKQGNMSGTVVLSIANPNSFAVTVKSADFTIWKDEIELGEAHLHEKFKINANSTESYPVKLNGDLSKVMGGGLMGIIG